MSHSKEEILRRGWQPQETQHSMKRRKPWHNYHLKGTYMLTLVVEGRRPVLGRLCSNHCADAQGQAAVSGAYIELSALGKAICNEEIRKISTFYPMVEIWKLCIMPDHIHMIVRVKEDLPEGKHLGHIVAGFKGGCSRAWWRIASNRCADAQGVVAKDAQGVVAATTPAASAAVQGKGAPLFEEGYNDLILVDEGQLENWKAYLDDNPRRLAVKRLHPDFFTTLKYRDIAEWEHCQLVGNSFLLDIPQKVAVIVHGAYGDQEFANYREQWLACGEAGGILVSAAIATREKEVMREAMDRGYRVILVRENGFPPLYKPAGEAFDACSAGRLLQVGPWAYHMERRRISREQCLILNRLVETIVGMP